MVGGISTHKTTRSGINFFMLFIICMSLYPVMLFAQASSIVISREPLSERTSNFGRRDSPCAGCSTNHRGQDYRARTPTTVQTNAPVTSCGYSNGYGYLAVVARQCANGNTVTERYAHLTSCPANGATSVLTGSSGRGTGPHLHYEILLGGSHIDPVHALGQDLCDPEVRREQLEHARQRGIQGGGGGATAPANPTNPPSGTPGGTPGGGTPGGGTPTTGTGGGGTPSTGNGGYNPPPARPPIVPAVIPPTTDDIVPTGGEGGDVTGCATDTWTAMVNQSVLQTRREMLMNQRYIAKADSVLAYSCFQDMYVHAGQTLGIFSESTRWANRQIDIIGRTVTVNVNMGQYSLDGAIADAVDTAVQSYLDNNFNHELLGGLLSGAHESEGEGGHEGHSHGDTQYGQPCGTMNNVWQMAKCHNVTDEPLFYRFEDLIDNDPRIYPHVYACEDSGITQGMIDLARHEEVLFDDIEPRLEMLFPEEGECHPPIPTGLTITRQVGEGRITEEVTYDDALCMTAGCSYQNPEFSGLGTCEIATP